MAAPLVRFLAGSLLAILPVLAQFPPTPEGVTTVESNIHPGVKVSYKDPGICEDTPGVKSYAGYISLPANGNGTDEFYDYPLNYFFWFFESRKDPANAPLSIWMNGGPGSSSLIGLLQENGPCMIANDSKTTVTNPWSWNNEVNMLYIDQPNQVGFSYDVPVNATFNEVTGVYTPTNFTAGNIPEQNTTFFVGTFPSQNPAASANTTVNGAHAFWYMAQAWFQLFPEYEPNDHRVSLWTESYGGHYGPAYAAHLEQQNKKVANGTYNGTGAVEINLDSLGIINGCIDTLSSELDFPYFAYNNTYGIQLINETLLEEAVEAWYRNGTGCYDLTVQCRALVAELDPDNSGDSEKANGVCKQADEVCEGEVEGVYYASGRGFYDIAHPEADPFPPEYFLGYLAQHEVQRALGVPINYTESVDSVYYGFSDTGDYVRGGFLENLAYVLDAGISVALVYGDRDWACMWTQGETSSLSVPYSSADFFAKAGYTPFITNATYTGGMTRQYGNFSFTRVFESGHEVPAYQPETAYEIFMRSIKSLDIATGTEPVSANYSTVGPESVFNITNEVPEWPETVCYTLSLGSCSDEDYAAVVGGYAIVEDYVVVGYTNGTRSEVPVRANRGKKSLGKFRSAFERRKLLERSGEF